MDHSATIAYYDDHAQDYIQNTKYVDFTETQQQFLSRLPEKALILDLGSGSGRDSKAFLETGCQVIAVDGSRKLAEYASGYIGQQVICSDFRDYEPMEIFDGIWACASLLHLDKMDLIRVMKKLAKHLSPAGCFYASFKYGEASGERSGRFFTDMTENTLNELLKYIPELRIDNLFISADVRPERSDEKWLNVFLTTAE